MTTSTGEIYRNFTTAYPDEFVLVLKYDAPGGGGSYYGTKLLKAQLKNGYDYLEVFKLCKPSACSMDSDEIKSKVFPFVYDTKGQTDTETNSSG
ncbi:unnamed protein product [Rotaria sordida]|uniref:Uncharacterized protein n=1 Tax=Rotaria sordida TaxID=392033 RepID=A0A820GQH0_9BILA|nr:unnamed protein product [Rotaria sordida]